MKSHTCGFSIRDLVHAIGFPLIPVIAFAVLMRFGVALHLLPGPRPTLDTDRTILVHQAEASRSKQDADLLLLGDSSCLMDVSAKRLGERLRQRTLNLGTLSYLDLNAYASMLKQYAGVNPGRPRVIVLLMHPEALRRVSPEADYVIFLRSFFDGADYCPGNRYHERLSCLLGLEMFRGRVLSRLLPIPLPGAYGRYYGFNHDLERFMTQHDGSALDPQPQPFKGNAEYRLAREIEPASRTFKSVVPTGAKLFVGITPVPQSFVGPNYDERYEQMLTEWSAWLQAEPLNLPPTLADDLFTRTTHLNDAGAAEFTAILAHALQTRLH